MCKKLFCTMIILIVLFIFALPVMAKPTEGVSDANLISSDSLTDSSNQDALNKETQNHNVLNKNKIDSIEDSELNKLLYDIIKGTDIEETEQILATFTKPQAGITKETIFTQLYIIVGCAEQENLGFIIARYNEETGLYEEYGNSRQNNEASADKQDIKDNENNINSKVSKDDNNSEEKIEIGISGFFSKEIQLKNGLNKLKLIIFKKPSVNDTKMVKNISDSGFHDVNNLEDYTDLPDMTSRNTRITLEPGKDLQINFFTINVIDENTKNSLINSSAKIDNVFEKKNIFDRIFNSK